VNGGTELRRTFGVRLGWGKENPDHFSATTATEWLVVIDTGTLQSSLAVLTGWLDRGQRSRSLVEENRVLRQTQGSS
jgi:hypothetical protein